MSERYLFVDPSLDTPPYVQIEEQLRAAVQRGDLAPGALLPTVRQLAGDLNVAPNTVARAYAELQAEGWLVSEGRRGTRVPARVPANDKRIRAGVLRETLENTVASLLARGYSRGEIRSELHRLTGG